MQLNKCVQDFLQSIVGLLKLAPQAHIHDPKAASRTRAPYEVETRFFLHSEVSRSLHKLPSSNTPKSGLATGPVGH